MQIHKTFRVEIETLSPLAIQSGEKLSPLTDYIIDGNELYYVEEEKFLDILSNNPNLRTDFEKTIEPANRITSESLKNFFEKNNLKFKTIIKSGPIRFYGNSPKKISTVIKSNGLPYIPGSTIKGAIKNAFLYHWINHYGKEMTAELVDTLENASEDMFDTILGGFQEKIINLAFSIPEDPDITKQPASNIQIRDSKPFKINQLAISTLKRKHCEQEIDTIPIGLQEYVIPGSVTQTEICISSSKLDWEKLDQSSHFANAICTLPNLIPLFKVLNEFFKDMLKDYDRFNLDTPPSNTEQNEAILFLGSGKGIYRNTILWAIKREYEKKGLNFKKFREYFKLPDSKNYEKYPTTCCHIENKPMGWVKIKDLTGKYN